MFGVVMIELVGDYQSKDGIAEIFQSFIRWAVTVFGMVVGAMGQSEQQEVFTVKMVTDNILDRFNNILFGVFFRYSE